MSSESPIYKKGKRKTKKENSGSEVQSVVFSTRKGWTLNTSKNKFKQMGYTLLNEKLPNGKFVRKKVDVIRSKKTNNVLQYRFRVSSPDQYKRFTTKKIANGKILLILGWKK